MMSVERKEQVEVMRDGGYERQRRVVEFAPSTRQVIVSRVSQLVWLFTTIIVGLSSFRFVLKLIAANPQNNFVDFIYDITDVLVAPFVGIINTQTFDDGMIFDPAALFAMVVYTLAAWVLVTLFRIVFADTKRSRHVTTVVQEK